MAGVPLGSIPAVCDFMIDVECMQSGALRCFRDEFAEIKKDTRRAAVAYRCVGTAVVVADAGGRSGLLLGPDVIDIAVGTAQLRGISVVNAVGVRNPSFLRAVSLSAPMQGVWMAVYPELKLRLAASVAGTPAVAVTDVPCPSLADPSAWLSDQTCPCLRSCVVICADARATERQLGPQRAPPRSHLQGCGSFRDT